MMNFQEYSSKMKELQQKILNFIEREDNVEENYQNLNKFILDHEIVNNRYEFKSFLYLIATIADYHCRRPTFFDKIEQILKNYENNIKNIFSNFEIFKIFRFNKHLILFLVEQKFIIIDKHIYNKMITIKTLQTKEFFRPEIESFLNDSEKKLNAEQKLPDDFYEKRKIGENDDYISELIRKDLIEEFIIFVKKNDFNLNSFIKPSIYETNTFLVAITREPTLIEYAAFFGSAQIFNFLHKNDANYDSVLWIFAIHSDNPEIINFLEEKNIQPFDISYEDCLSEAVKCHHNDIANYIINNFLDQNVESINLRINIDRNLLSYSFKYYNYYFFPDELENNFIFYYACHFDYFEIVEYFIRTKAIELSEDFNIYNLLVFLNQV